MTDVPPIELGSALFSLVEPHAGCAREFNRWYERDHFYAGCMVGPGFFAGRRWVATRAMKQLRMSDGPPTLPEGRGSLLVLYWILAGQHQETVDWAVTRVQQLHRQNRMNPARDNISTNFYQHHWSVSRDADGVRPELALDHPFAGLSVMLVEPGPDSDTEAFEARCREHVLPNWLPDSPLSLLLCMAPEPLPEGAPGNVKHATETSSVPPLLWLGFMDRAPDSFWAESMSGLATSLRSDVGGRLTWAAPFVPTVPGTDTYMDEL